MTDHPSPPNRKTSNLVLGLAIVAAVACLIAAFLADGTARWVMLTTALFPVLLAIGVRASSRRR